MSTPAKGSLYGLCAFGLLVIPFLVGTRDFLSWDFPSENRLASQVSLGYFLLAGGYALLVGRHRDLLFDEALVAAVRDVGRKIKQLILR